MRMYMRSDLEYLSIYFKKLKSYPDTKDNILISTSQDEAPGALFVEVDASGAKCLSGISA